MNFRHIEIFIAVMECGSVTEAAARLGLSQPAVSKSIKIMETQLKISLFIRAAKGIQATDEARALYLQAGRVTDGFAHLVEFARNLPKMHHARLQVSCIPALSLNWLPSVVGDFILAYPEVSVSFVSRSSPETVQLVAQGEIDIGISQLRAEEVMVEKTRLFDLRLVCVVPRAHPLATRDALRLADLNGERIISLSKADELRKAFEAAMHMHGFTFQTKLDVALGSMLSRMVDIGAGIGLIDHESAKLHNSTQSVIVPLEPQLAVPIYLMQNIAKPQSLVARKMVEFIRKQTMPTL